jgi:hypothetical protein
MVGARLFPLLILCTLAACREPTNEKLLDLIDEYDYRRDDSRAVVCMCPGELGYATPEECEQGLGDIGPDEKACIADAFEGHDELAVDYFECIVPIELSAWQCLSALVTECPPDWFVPCEEMKTMDVSENCPSLPSDVEAAYAACLSF